MTDGTADEVLRVQSLYPDKDIRLKRGPGVCKSRNVWTGFDDATGDILMILDADLTTIPEELPYFVDVIASGQAEFVNGSRLVYPVPKEAMTTTNMLGNKLFSVAFTYLLGQRVKDTLCGTKVLWRSDWQRIRPMLGSWGSKTGGAITNFCLVLRNSTSEFWIFPFITRSVFTVLPR